MTDVQAIKRRFGVIGTNLALDRAISVAAKVAPTDISVLVLGESGVGKEIMPRIVHQFSKRKHDRYIAVNCGAIPQGTIDSELFGHVKGAFTDATSSRKGYFEEADQGTIFLDEVAELPLTTQVRLLRVLETGEFMRVGSSQAQKTDVRVVAATNVDFDKAMLNGKFREDLYYRLSQVPIHMPALRDRGGDIHLLFRKFTTDFSEMYRMPPLRLTPDAIEMLDSYPWPGNVRQLKNTAEQMSILEQNRSIDADTLLSYLPETHRSRLPARIGEDADEGATGGMTEREMLYKVLIDMRSEVEELKRVMGDLLQNGGAGASEPTRTQAAHVVNSGQVLGLPEASDTNNHSPVGETVEEVLSLQDSERELIRKALEKHNKRRKYAALELGISERTLYRKIKEYDLK